MKTDGVEKIIKRKFQPGKSLQEQTTPEEWDEICFWSEVETEVISAQSMVNRTGTGAEIEARVKAKWQKVLDDCGGDYKQALNFFS